jgi:hypothetical protein
MSNYTDNSIVPVLLSAYKKMRGYTIEKSSNNISHTLVEEKQGTVSALSAPYTHMHTHTHKIHTHNPCIDTRRPQQGFHQTISHAPDKSCLNLASLLHPIQAIH